uniref:WAT1-related protein n=1 Tax=Oryza meridionalis TaxID=40149 RepID=A0A0E0EB93_9ORYZ
MAPAATGGGGGEDDAAVPLLLPVLPPAAGWCSWEWEDVAISAGLVAVQLAGAAYMVVLAPVLALGLDPLFLVTFGSLATGLFTLPFAINLERKRWPVTVFQALMLHGTKKTSPAIASTMPNLAPVFIFVVAACLGFERVDLSCRYTRAKIAGTVLCLAGAVTMSVLQSPAAAAATRSSSHRTTTAAAANAGGGDWAVGCACLLGAVLVVSGTTVLQAATMVHFPAPFTLCSATSLAGAALTGAMLRVTIDGWIMEAYGGLVSSVCVMFQTWALEKKGPVVVSLFSPTQTVGSAIFSAFMLGMVFLFSGLYVVLWAKKKECQVDRMVEDGTANDIEKPLLFQD